MEAISLAFVRLDRSQVKAEVGGGGRDCLGSSQSSVARPPF